ncbi:hypothetical protein TWF281_002572 [Arthrobotrys megalospora]
MPQHLCYPVSSWDMAAAEQIYWQRPNQRPPRRQPHKDRGVSQIAELLWNVYAQERGVDPDLWFTKRLASWLECHWRAVYSIRSKLDDKLQELLFLSWDDPRMTDPIVWSFGWYLLYIALMTLTLRDYEELCGMGRDDVDELERDGTLWRLNKEVTYATHHIKVAIEVLESLEEETLRKHVIGKLYLSALNEASVYVLSIYGYGEWVTPLKDSRTKKDPIGTFLSWFQQPFSVIRARNNLDSKFGITREDYPAQFQNIFGGSYTCLSPTIARFSPTTAQEGITSMSAEMNTINGEGLALREGLVSTDGAYVEECPSSPLSCYNGSFQYDYSPPEEFEMYSAPQDFSSSFSEQPHPNANYWDSMGQFHYQYTEQPNQFDYSNQWVSGNQYDPYMGFTWDQELN